MRNEVKIFLVLLVASSLFTHWTSWNEQANYAMSASITEQSVLHIDEYNETTGDFINHQGHSYAQFNRWAISSISTGPYFLFSNLGLSNSSMKFLLTVLISGVFFSLSAVIIYNISDRFFKSELKKIGLTLVFGFSTLVFQQARLFTAHSLEVFFSSLIIFLLFDILEKDKLDVNHILLLSVSLAIGLFLTPFFRPLFLFILLALLYKRRWKEASIIFTVSLLLFLPAYQGYWMEIDAKESETTILPAEISSEQDYPTELEFFPKAFTGEIYSLGTLLQTTIYPSKGLFFYYPVLIFSFLGFYLLKKQRLLSLILLLFSVSVILANLLIPMWWLGWVSFGPVRIFAIIMPALFVGVMKFVQKFGWKIILPFILFSLFSNFLLLQYGEDSIGQTFPNEYYDKMESLSVLSNPLHNHYYPLSRVNGPRSVLLENLLIHGDIDIQLSPHSQGADSPVMDRFEVPLFAPAFGIVVLRLPYLALFLFFVSVFLLWQKEILHFFGLLEFRKLVYLLILLSFFVTFIGIEDTVYGEGWYAPEWDGDQNVVDEGRWLGRESELFVISEGRENELSFSAESYGGIKDLELLVNGQEIERYSIEDKERVVEDISLEPGRNKITFNSPEDCKIEGKMDYWGYRCLSFKISDINLQ
ncbi:MAG: hypothetical protein ACLFQ8_01545 [Candidatus Aenigmatarchaeota archaeon]